MLLKRDQRHGTSAVGRENPTAHGGIRALAIAGSAHGVERQYGDAAPRTTFIEGEPGVDVDGAAVIRVSFVPRQFMSDDISCHTGDFDRCMRVGSQVVVPS